MLLRGVGGDPPTEERERASLVLGQELDQTLFERRHEQVTRADVELPLDAEARALQCLGIDLGKELALGKIERGNRDRIVRKHRGGHPGRRRGARRQQHGCHQSEHRKTDVSSVGAVFAPHEASNARQRGLAADHPVPVDEANVLCRFI